MTWLLRSAVHRKDISWCPALTLVQSGERIPQTYLWQPKLCVSDGCQTAELRNTDVNKVWITTATLIRGILLERHCWFYLRKIFLWTDSNRILKKKSGHNCGSAESARCAVSVWAEVLSCVLCSHPRSAEEKFLTGFILLYADFVSTLTLLSSVTVFVSRRTSSGKSEMKRKMRSYPGKTTR